MNNKYVKFLLILFTSSIITISCSDADDNSEYIEIVPSPVSVDLTQVPYSKLSDYHFFKGDLKNQIPEDDVLPYKPIATLFTDYALKKRFVWMPKGAKATYNTDDTNLELPVGAAIIKTFYYDNMQPNNTTRIIETRIMIRKNDGWIFADYVWNDEQTEAYLDMLGSTTAVSFKNNNNQIIDVPNYDIPNESQCIICHKERILNPNGTETVTNIPIGIKPQLLNSDYNYGNGYENQLAKWVAVGYLDSNFTYPTAANTCVDYNDTSKPIDIRMRSYFDVNCAHCHNENRHCDYRMLRLSFKNTGLTNGLANMGVCQDTEDMQGFAPALSKVVTPMNKNRSMLYHRLNTTDASFMMPLHGRTIIHTEGVALIEQWINSLEPCQ